MKTLLVATAFSLAVAGCSTGKKDDGSKGTNPLVSTLLIIGAAVAGGKINANTQSNNPQTAARAKKAKEEMGKAITLMNDNAISDKAKNTNNPLLCVKDSSSSGNDKDLRTVSNRCNYPIYVAVVHHHSKSRRKTSYYDQRLSPSQSHAIIESRDDDFVEVSSCFNRPKRNLDERFDVYFSTCESD
ncbi:MAG: hypothetical protein RR715_01625 [Comamonas sp.]